MWKPQLASRELEQHMERKEIPESDRDELRKFAEVLNRVKSKRDGQKLPPMPAAMKDFITGADCC